MAVIFLGPNGLRLPWRLALFAVSWIGLLYALTPFARLIQPPPAPTGLETAVATGINEGLVAAVTLAATLIASFCDGSYLAAQGFGLRRGLRLFGIGGVCGAGAVGLLCAVIVLGGGASLSLADAALGNGVAAGLAWFLAMVAAAFFEEAALRGYLLHTLWRSWGFAPAAIITSLLFGALHLMNGGETPFGSLNACLIGYAFCLVIRRTGSLWWGVGFHAAWNWTESFVFGAPDSGMLAEGHLLTFQPNPDSLLGGGSVGPEGSPAVLGVIALMIVGARWGYRPSGGSS